MLTKDMLAKYDSTFRGRGILISPFSNRLPDRENPKTYPYWEQVVEAINEMGGSVIQIGYYGESKIKGVDMFLVDSSPKQLLKFSTKVSFRVSVDNFYQHFCHYHKLPCVVIFSQSDPEIFGHEEHINLLRGEEYLRQGNFQYDLWQNSTYDPDAFVHPLAVIDAIHHLSQQK